MRTIGHRSTVVGLTFALAGAWLLSGVAVAADPTGDISGASTGGLLPNSAAKSTLVQDPTFLSEKAAGLISVDASGAPIVLSAAQPASGSGSGALTFLDTQWAVEPEGRYYDDLHHAESDLNYWNFCSAGSAATAIYYWNNSKFLSWLAGYFTERYGPDRFTTYWRSSDTGTSSDTSDGYATKGRSSIMYFAEQVKPPSYGSPGIDNFNVYPTNGGSLPDVRDALNWEASNHGSNWQNYFYVVANPSETTLHTDIVDDIAGAGRALVAAVNTAYLPNWSRSLGHAITIIGYDDFNGTYTYLDTCGHQCNGSSKSTNGGHWDISQHSLYLAISSAGQGIVW